MPAFREYFEVFQLFHLAKIFHGMKKEQKNVTSDDLPDREGVRPPKQGGGGEEGEIRAKGVAEETGERGRQWQGRQSSEGLCFKIHPRLSRRPIGEGMDFSMARLETKRDDGSVHDETKIIYSLHTPVSNKLRLCIVLRSKHPTICEYICKYKH